MEVNTTNIESIKYGLGATISTMQSWSQWLGREVVVLSNKCVQLVHSLVLAAFGLAKSGLELTRPIFNGAAGFVRSSGGVVSLTITGALLLGYMSGKTTDNTSKLALLGLSYLVFGFGLVYGCQMGVIPLLV